jgi:hypothetical protein
LIEICRRFSGTTRTLSSLRAELNVKDLVCVMNHFPGLQKSSEMRNEMHAEIEEAKEILIRFDELDKSISDDTESGFSQLEKDSEMDRSPISSESEADSVVTSESFSSSGNEFLITKDSFSLGKSRKQSLNSARCQANDDEAVDAGKALQHYPNETRKSLDEATPPSTLFTPKKFLVIALIVATSLLASRLFASNSAP